MTLFSQDYRVNTKYWDTLKGQAMLVKNAFEMQEYQRCKILKGCAF